MDFIALHQQHQPLLIANVWDAIIFARKLQELDQACPGVFLNICTDTFLLSKENALQETLFRGRLYAEHGANGFFVPGVTRSDDIAAIAHEVSIPLNVMCMPELADFDTLAMPGVRPISMGNFVHAAIETQLQDLLCTVQTQQSFARVFSHENH